MERRTVGVPVSNMGGLHYGPMDIIPELLLANYLHKQCMFSLRNGGMLFARRCEEMAKSQAKAPLILSQPYEQRPDSAQGCANAGS
jgi:hypothetical protein